jgi:hypothetical protein
LERRVGEAAPRSQVSLLPRSRVELPLPGVHDYPGVASEYGTGQPDDERCPTCERKLGYFVEASRVE